MNTNIESLQVSAVFTVMPAYRAPPGLTFAVSDRCLHRPVLRDVLLEVPLDPSVSAPITAYALKNQGFAGLRF
jgi:hypothetical protein